MASSTLVVLGVVLGVAAAASPVRVAVVSGNFLSEPAFVRLRVRVEPDAANRVLTTEIESDDFSTSSDEDLRHGTRPSRWVDFKNVPAGVYTARATVTRGAERPWRATAGFTVLGPSP